VADVAVDSLQVVSGQRVVLGRDAGGLYGMTAVCTHNGCTVGVAGGATPSLACPCHGSAFDLNGQVTRGPAGRPLQHFQVDVDAATGDITIQADLPVTSDVRTPVA
jgi:Rieske Fe-S protein